MFRQRCSCLALLLCSLFIAYTSSFRSSIRTFPKGFSTRFGVADVGDVVVAEVEDIGGTVSDPRVSFKIIGRDGPFIAGMSAKSLSSAEKMALQAGSMMKVVVTKVEGELNTLLIFIYIHFDVIKYAKKKKMTGKNIEVELSASSSQTKKFSSSAPPSSAGRMYSAAISSDKKFARPNQVMAGLTYKKPPGLLLNNLKCGLELTGKVSSCTQYGAFIAIEPKVSRIGKAGLYTEVVGLLHSSDMLDFRPTTETKTDGKKHQIFTSKTNERIIRKDVKLAVFVKEVWKNSGRFTLTLDANVDKTKLLEKKANAKSEGLARRRARRLRRMVGILYTFQKKCLKNNNNNNFIRI